MDNPGWKAQRKAAQENHLYDHPQRETNGHFTGVEHADPMNEAFIGPLPFRVQHQDLPPQDSEFMPGQMSPDARSTESVSSTAVERSQIQKRNAPPRMNPHLQVMCGPLLRYDTIDSKGFYRGAILIVTADAGSVYEPHPNVVLSWDPDYLDSSRTSASRARTLPSKSLGAKNTELVHGLPSVLAEVPSSFAGLSIDKPRSPGPRAQKEVVPGQEIWVYHEGDATFTFWRFLFDIPLSEKEMVVRYRVNNGPTLEFYVPAREQNMRWATYSCNGFSSGVNTDEFCGPGFSSGSEPLWWDLVSKHAQTPFHVLVGGGDQIYCDGLTREPELQDWVNIKDQSTKKSYQLTDEILSALDRFYFSHYCLVFRTGAFARANSTIPMLNMLDDHDLIDGFGSYPDDLQRSPIFSAIGSRGYFFFLLFQCFIVTDIDGKNPGASSHTFRSTIIGGDGSWIPYPSHSILSSMGPRVYMLMLDCRSERKKDQVCSHLEYQRVLESLYRIPKSVEHLIVQTGSLDVSTHIVFARSALENKYNPLVILGRTGSLGLSGFVNKFNSDAELLDDLNDHWTAKGHKKERNWFIERMQDFARARNVRVSFLSGDVHCAAVGVLKTLAKGKEPHPEQDHRYMVNIVTSAIVNTPPPAAVLSLVGALADKRHRTMHYADTDETMFPLFERDTNGTPSKSKFIMGRRNWCSVHWKTNGELEFDIRVEKEKGAGHTIGYPLRVPPPLWTAR